MRAVNRTLGPTANLRDPDIRAVEARFSGLGFPGLFKLEGHPYVVLLTYSQPSCAFAHNRHAILILSDRPAAFWHSLGTLLIRSFFLSLWLCRLLGSSEG